jgi:TfoX/Sxy family transcriptional regulator of competence genes
VAYDEELAARLRILLGGEPGLTERKMFGGLAFLVNGNMAVAASGEGGILVRIDPTDSSALVRDTEAYPMEMRGRTMDGWLRIDAKDVAGESALREWVDRGVGFAARCRRNAPDAASLSASRGVAQPG